MLHYETQEWKEDITEQDSYLANITRNNPPVSDNQYRETHQTVKLRINSLSGESKQLKQDLFQWAENVMS